MPASQIRLFAAAFVAAAFCFGPATARERPATAPAARFLQDTIDRAFGLVRPPVSNQAAADLESLIESSMDWPSLTDFALGHYGAALDADGMSSVTERLERRLQFLAHRAGADSPSMTIAIRDMRIDSDGNRRILSTATVPQFGEIEVEWTVVPNRTGYHIADIKALGMTLRQFLRGWIASLVAARGGDAAAALGEGIATSPQ